jgi:hypothetical protein
LHTDRTSVLLHDSLTDGESKSRSLVAPAEAGIEDLREVLLRDPFAGIGKIDDRDSLLQAGGDR